ncbi:MAG: sigma-70 family RNA polymerase sigma factor, partial [Planctomycetota bacterium]
VKHLSIAARNKSRRSASDEEMLSALPAPASGEHDPRRAELAGVLKVLPEPQREVLLMRFVDTMSQQEIAEALAIPLGTVKSRLHNALQTLRNDRRTRDYFIK